jgi:hypothetical protein
MPRYRVVTTDNFHYMETRKDADSGVFESYEAAAAACREIVDRSLAWHHKPGMTAKRLYDDYQDFGDDPYIVAIDGAPHGERFSAWTYAKQRCREICGG